jgi:recombination protein RecT
MSNNALVVVRTALERKAPDLRQLLPVHIDTDKFIRTALVAMARNPKIAKAPVSQLYLACSLAATDGLLLDNREAALVQFGESVTYMPMVAGILKKARQSGEISTFVAEVVHEKDEFGYKNVDGKVVFLHAPNLFADRGPIVGVYAAATLKDGSFMVEVLTKAQVERVRAVSRAKNAGPWTEWWEEMAKKTAIRRLSKRLPSSVDKEGRDLFREAVERDDEMYDMDDGVVVEAQQQADSQVSDLERRVATQGGRQSPPPAPGPDVIDVEPDGGENPPAPVQEAPPQSGRPAAKAATSQPAAKAATSQPAPTAATATEKGDDLF